MILYWINTEYGGRMKITLEVGKDEELRTEILKLIRSEARNITGEEIREIVKTCMLEQNIPARVISAFKDLVNSQIKQFESGYGKIQANEILKNKFSEIVDKQFNDFFKQQCIPYLQNYIKNNLLSTAQLITGILKSTDKDKS